MGGGAGVNQVTISAAEFIRLANRIKELENTLVRIATLADSDEFESQEINAIWMLATEATTEDSSADQKEVQG
jgi:H2-forming N5,N10-methylenetetrahydromethanopterin dehydrogenase-like enzyme